VIPDELKQLMEEGRTLRKRAAARMKQFKRRGSLFRGDKGQRVALKRRDSDDVDDDAEETEEERRQRLASEEENFRAWVERELASIADGESRDYNEMVFRGGAEALLTPFRRRQIMMQVAEEYGLYTLAPAGMGKMPPRNSTSLERAPDIAESSVMPEPGCLRVYNMKTFAASMIDKFKTMGPGGRAVIADLKFSEEQQALVHLLALDRDLVAVFERWGSSGVRLVVHDTTSFANGLNAQLSALNEGDAVSLSANLTNIELKYAQAQAAKMGMTIVRAKNEKGEECLKVFNMTEFANDVREKLNDVDVGSRAVFKNLSEQERTVVHAISNEMGLHSVEGEGTDLRHVVVQSNAEFIAAQAARMSQAAEAGSGDFLLPKTARAQKDFWDMVDKNGLGLDASFHGLEKSRSDFRYGDTVRLTGIKSFDSSSASDGEALEDMLAQGVHPRTVEGVAMTDEQSTERQGFTMQKAEPVVPTIETSSELIRQAFEAYATGNHRGERTFLRYVDLKEFASDLRRAMPGRKQSMRDFSVNLELCFEDTTQLQTDFGIRAGPGLTHQFFQVFIQKAMTKLGLQVASVLFEVLNEHA